MTGDVILDADTRWQDHGIGASSQCALEAERSALWWGASRLMREGGSCPVRFVFDATAAGFHAGGLQSGTDQNKSHGLGGCLRGLFQL